MTPRPIPDADLQNALAYAARLAATRGRDVPAFVAVFERLESLAAERQKQESALERARRMAGMM